MFKSASRRKTGGGKVSAAAVAVVIFFGGLIIAALAAARVFGLSFDMSSGFLPAQETPPPGASLAWEHVYVPQNLPRMNVGRAAAAADIAAWNIDIRFDGQGLPPGEAAVEEGGEVYDAKCAWCHGDFGQGEGRWPVLAGGFESLTNQGGHHRPEKTVGSYWPYVATVYDYIYRAMPYNAPQSLTAEETYGLVAYILYLNDLVDESFVASAETLKNYKMPNEANFEPDPRPDAHNIACMKNCADKEKIALIESIRGVTPLEHLQETAETADSAAAAADLPAAAAIVVAAEATERGVDNAGNAANAAAARQYRQFCGGCHDSGVADSPLLHDTANWRQRLTQGGGEQSMIQAAINGKGAMPPKGGAVNLSEAEIGALVRYMLQQAGVKTP